MIWELRYASVNDYAMVVPLDDEDTLSGRFDMDGNPKNWMDRPLVGFADSKRQKHKRPPADVSAMVPGALVLNERAKETLGTFLSKFGQLLELDCGGTGEIRYLYNVTNIVRCVDVERSEKTERGRIKMEVFNDAAVPKDASIFKDPSTVTARIYVNEEGKAILEPLIAGSKLTGIECGVLMPRAG
jgi:hypothetical protein